MPTQTQTQHQTQHQSQHQSQYRLQSQTQPQAQTQPEAQPRPRTETVIADERARIDQLDARILGLVRERVEASARVQEARIAAGGRRVHLARENEILARYRAELGRPGTDLAMTLLGLCRGQR